MATLGDFLILLGLGGTIWGAVRLFRQRKHPSTKRLNLILLIGSIILMFIGTPMSDTKTSTGSTSQSSVVNKRLTTKQRKLLNTERTHGKVLLAVKAKKNAELKALTKEQTKLEAAQTNEHPHRERQQLPHLLLHPHQHLRLNLPVKQLRHPSKRLPHRKQRQMQPQPNKQKKPRNRQHNSKLRRHSSKRQQTKVIYILARKEPSLATAVARSITFLVKPATI